MSKECVCDKRGLQIKLQVPGKGRGGGGYAHRPHRRVNSCHDSGSMWCNSHPVFQAVLRVLTIQPPASVATCCCVQTRPYKYVLKLSMPVIQHNVVNNVGGGVCSLHAVLTCLYPAPPFRHYHALSVLHRLLPVVWSLTKMGGWWPRHHVHGAWAQQ